MKIKITKSIYLGISVGAVFFTMTAYAKTTTMVITSAPQSLQLNSCSTAVTVSAENDSSQLASVPVNTTIYFTGSSNSLKFFTDSLCKNSTSTLQMKAGTNKKSFYFKGSSAGAQKLVVATYQYNDGQQTEQILKTGPTPAPTPISTPTPTPSPIPVPKPTPVPPSPTPVPPVPTPVSQIGRAVPAPIYGVTLDDITNVSGIINSLSAIVHMPTARIVFDAANGPDYYLAPIQQIHPHSYVMGQILDSTDMANISVASFQSRAQSYVNLLGSNVDIWEIGNEINGSWVGSDTAATGDKVRAAYDVVHQAKGATALTFFWEGNPTDANNCVDGPGYDMFGWIQNFLANPANDRVRLGLDYVFISWYPQQCNNIKPDWPTIFNKLNAIFPNAKVGFGEVGTANPQNGSQYEINLLNEFYPMASHVSLPPNYVGGYFWWYFYEEMIPTTRTPLMNVLNQAILSGPQP